MTSWTEKGMPTHQQLVYAVVEAVESLGGSAKSREIVDHVVENFPSSEKLIEERYPNRPDTSVFIDRVTWGRSTAKLIGALEQPSRGIYLSTDLGKELLAMGDERALEQVRELDREYYRRRKAQNAGLRDPLGSESEQTPSTEVIDDLESEDDASVSGWKAKLLNRLHRLSPEGFEKFVLYLLRRYGLELTHLGGTGDEGIDGIGMAPLSPVLSSRVAVQVKRYDPNGKPIGRETVALFQRDAQTKGAERAILVTLSRFTEPARKAATSAIPTVGLIDGDRLAELIRKDGESGVTLQPTVNEHWFDRFD